MNGFKVFLASSVLLLIGTSWVRGEDAAEPKKVKLRVTEINGNEGFIAGTVENLTSEELSEYVIAIYIQSDIYYRHPYADHLTLIEEDGRWQSKHIQRGGEKRIAVFVVKEDAELPSQIRQPNEIKGKARKIMLYRSN